MAGVIAAALIGHAAPPAGAQKPIKGYTWCGTKDFETGEWHYGQTTGVFLDAYARNMSCHAARRNVDRTRFGARPYRTGYRCREITSAHEYSSVRCVKKNGKRAFRFITGA